MMNEEIASQFNMIADLMEIRGDEGYRLRAYRRGAETIHSSERPVYDIWQEGALKDLPGIGEAIADKIDSYITTGKIPVLEELKAEIPESLLELTRISDVGPKKAAKFWRELNITDIDQLELAAKEGRLRSLSGMGEKSESKILLGIDAYKRQKTDRISIEVASQIALDIANKLKILNFVERVETAGSLRRGRETIGDLDLVVATADVESAIEYLLANLDIRRVRGRGKTKLSVETENGIRVQVWFHALDRFGTAWQFATGSQAHNVRLREIASKQGLSLSEHNFQREDGSEIKCSSEEAVYHTLGLPWIAPELREDRGEIQAGIDGTLPHLLHVEDIKGEFHTHSTWSDGSETIEDMANSVRARGFNVMAITDHSHSLGIANGLSVDRLDQQKEEISRLNALLGSDFHLLQGAEVEILADGRLDYPDGVLQELDLVIASLHTSLRQDRETITDRLLNAIRNPNVDIIAHPTGRILRQREGADLDMEQIFQAAAENQVALEINANPDRLDLNDLHAKRAVELGCVLTINTDAHSIQHLEFLQYGVGIARRAWVSPEQVMNTWAVDQFLHWLADRRS